MSKKFKAPDPDQKRVQYGAEVVRRINEGAAGVVPPALQTFEAFAEPFAASPEPSPAPADHGWGEPDPQGDSAASEKEN